MLNPYCVNSNIKQVRSKELRIWKLKFILILPLTHQVTSDEFFSFADSGSLILKTGGIIPACFTGS